MGEDIKSVEIPHIESLCCVKCRHALEVESDTLICLSCGYSVPVENGVPLFSVDYIEAVEKSTASEKFHRSRIGGRFPYLKKLYKYLKPPSFQFLQRGDDKLELYIETQRLKYKSPLIVDIGAGAKRWGDVMSVDICNYPGIDYCAYADALPFKDGSVDMLISSSAIEHFKSMKKVYDEFYRVVKPGGIIFISAPFVYPFHAEPSDYHRWSANGLVDDFSGFDVIESGGYAGPHSAVHSVLSSYFAWMFAFGNHTVYMILNILFGWLLFPLQVADRLRGQYKGATPIDGIAYYIGKKPVK